MYTLGACCNNWCDNRSSHRTRNPSLTCQSLQGTPIGHQGVPTPQFREVRLCMWLVNLPGHLHEPSCNSAAVTQMRTQGGPRQSCPQWLHDSPQLTIGDATLSAENSGKPQSSQGSASEPRCGAHSAPDPLVGRERGGCCPLPKNPIPAVALRSPPPI